VSALSQYVGTVTQTDRYKILPVYLHKCQHCHFLSAQLHAETSTKCFNKVPLYAVSHTHIFLADSYSIIV